MIIEMIINNDLISCYESMQKDLDLKQSENEFYNLLNRVDDDIKIKLEENYSKFTSRAMRIAYVQGFKDFYEMCLILKDDALNIVNRMNNIL